MAVRPLVTTGAALLSAGALVAGTPALFVPHDEITVAASSVEDSAHKTLTQEQVNLLASSFSIGGVVDAYWNGYGSFLEGNQGYVSDPGYVLDADGNVVDVTADTPTDTPLVGVDGTPIYLSPEGGEQATVADIGDGVQFYYGDGDGAYVYDPGNCSATGAQCLTGMPGVFYYMSDLLPLGGLNTLYFEGGGAPALFYLASSVVASLADGFDPTGGRLDLQRRVDDFFYGPVDGEGESIGVANGLPGVAYGLIYDNLPDDAAGTWAKGLNYAFFSGGLPGAVNYLVNNTISLTDTSSISALSVASPENGIQAALKAVEDGLSSVKLPSVASLVSLNTEKQEASPKKLLADSEEAAGKSTVAAGEDVEAAAEAPSVADEPSTSEPTKPSLLNLKLPNLQKPQAVTKDVESVSSTPDTEESAKGAEDAKTGAEDAKEGAEAPKTDTQASKRGQTRSGLFAKPGGKAGEQKKSSPGDNFVANATKSLEKAFKPKTKAGADAHGKSSGKGDSSSAGSDSGSSDHGDK